MRIEQGFEDPAASRIQVSSLTGETSIVIPAAKQPFAMIFMIVWLGGWTVGGLSAFHTFTAETGHSDGRAFLGFWLCGWAFGEIAVIGSLLWMLLGKEIITANLVALVHRYQLLVSLKTRRYQPAAISNLRWEAGNGNQYTRYGRQSSVSFEYGPKTVSIAKGCDAGEAALIISTITRSMGRKLADRSSGVQQV